MSQGVSEMSQGLDGAGVPAPPWFFCPRPNPSARLRLFGFPYAGGGALVYRQWAECLPAFVEFSAVELPGRGHRIKESPFATLEPLVESLAQAVSPYLDRPFSFFGHSLGALVGFELARHLRRRKGLEPAQLFASGASAPQLLSRSMALRDLPTPELLARLRELDGTPVALLDNSELMALMLPILRADFSVSETYAYYSEAPFSCPITVLGGEKDEGLDRERLEAWRSHTADAFSLRMLPGNHFFIHAERERLLRILSTELRTLAERLDPEVSRGSSGEEAGGEG